MVTFFFFLVGTLLAVLPPGVPEPTPTFRETDPITGNDLVCDQCPPGSYLQSGCTRTQGSDCRPCPAGSFTEVWNYISKCLRCSVCRHNQVVKSPCTTKNDCECECREGFFYKRDYDTCLPHSECPAGQGVTSKGSADEDTACHICPNGTFSNTISDQDNCTQHRSCRAAGLALVLRGSTWHDSVCMNCSESASKDGADYLKEIIPSFFTHQKMPVRRLRHILRKLPSENGRRHERISSMFTAELLQKINSWAASAAPAQIRQLPSILEKTGANGAAERLQNKLIRIDANVAELCSPTNRL